jgi:DNA replication protein DnaC
VHRRLQARPADRVDADRAAMVALPPVAPMVGWRLSTRLPRDHYVRVGANDYSAHPSAIGRRVDIRADAGQVEVTCDGRPVAAHARCWAAHQSITDPLHRDPAAGRAPPHRQNPDPHRRRAPRPRRLRPHVRPRQRGGLMHAKATTSRNVTSELAFLARALKAPSLGASVERLAERARSESWTHEEFLAACLQREVAARESHGGEGRIRGARFPARKSLEEFDYEHQRSLKRDQIAHLGTLDFVTGKENVVFLGPPGTGKTHLSIGLGIRACQAGHRVAFATAAQWVARLADAHHAGTLQAELVKLGRIPLLIIDEVGYIPFEAEAANLFFQLVSSRYERASLIVTSNKPFGRWGEVFGDDVVAAAMIDRLVHHADVISMKGDSYRLKDRDLGRVPAATKTND